jgi:hypothetical protein
MNKVKGQVIRAMANSIGVNISKTFEPYRDHVICRYSNEKLRRVDKHSKHVEKYLAARQRQRGVPQVVLDLVKDTDVLVACLLTRLTARNVSWRNYGHPVDGGHENAMLEFVKYIKINATRINQQLARRSNARSNFSVSPFHDCKHR